MAKSNESPWKTAVVAQAQRELVEKQLLAPLAVAPFKAFIDTLKALPLKDGMTLVDVGCGVGHYGVLVSRYFPQIEYTGTDYSRAMIEAARELNAGTKNLFRIKSFSECEWWGYDLALVSQVMEYLSNPWDGLKSLCERKYEGHIILHRLRLTTEPSRKIEAEACYCGTTAQNYLWNLEQVLAFVKQHGAKVVKVNRWDECATIVLRS